MVSHRFELAQIDRLAVLTQCFVDARHYEAMMELMNDLLDRIGDGEKHALSGLLDVVTTFVRDYEQENAEISDAASADVLRSLMEQHQVRSVFRDLFPEDRVAKMEMRAQLLSGLHRWLADSGLTQVDAAKALGVTQARVSDLKRGKISRFSLDLLVRLAARAGLHPRLKLAA